jgi:Fur family transcriptional regulator, ferric uptake regulator
MAQERSTRQRKAIEDALSRAERPMTPEELLELARSEVPNMGIATIYRAIKDMRGTGDVVAVEVPGHPTCYESAHRGHHHHFHCRACQRVFEVEACAHGINAMAPAGFRIEDHEIVLRGLCAACAHAG